MCLLLRFFFFADNHEKALRSRADDPEFDILDNNEGYIAALLTSHLLSPLIPGHQYIISNDYQDKLKYCPCLTACMRKMNYGGTKIGKAKLSICQFT